MNTTDPVGPQGLLDRQSQGKSTIRVAIFLIVSIHAVFFAGLLMQGCKRDETKIPLRTAESSASENPRLPDTNQIYTNPQEVPQETSITGASNTALTHELADAILAGFFDGRGKTLSQKSARHRNWPLRQ